MGEKRIMLVEDNADDEALDRLTVLRRLRANPRTKLLPIVILTSSKEDRDVIGAYDLGANSYVQKPVDFTDFADAIRRLGPYWLLTNAPPPMKG